MEAFFSDPSIVALLCGYLDGPPVCCVTAAAQTARAACKEAARSAHISYIKAAIAKKAASTSGSLYYDFDDAALLGKERAVDAFLQLLSHDDAHVRSKVCRSVHWLGNNAAWGDQRVIDAMLVLLSGEDVLARIIAVESLGKVALSGNQMAVDALLPLLLEPNQRSGCLSLWAKVVSSLRSVTLQGNQRVIGSLLQLILEPGKSVGFVWEAVGCLRIVARKGDQHVVSAMISLLEHSAERVVTPATIALGEIANQCDQRAIEALLRLALDQDVDVEASEVLKALCKVMKRGDQRLINVICSMIVHPEWNDPWIWQLADMDYETLDLLGLQNCPQIIDALCSALTNPRKFWTRTIGFSKGIAKGKGKGKGKEESEAMIRPCFALPGALGKMAGRGNQRVINILLSARANVEALSARCPDCDPDRVLSFIVSALGELATKSDQHIVKIALDYLADWKAHPSIACGAVRALGKLTEPGNQDVINAVLSCIDGVIPLDWERGDRIVNSSMSLLGKDLVETCFVALGDIAVRGDETVIDALLVTNYRSTIAPLGKVAAQGDEDVIDFLLHMLFAGEDFESQVDAPTEAAKALGNVTIPGNSEVIKALLVKVDKCTCGLDQEDARLHAVKALGKVTIPGDKEVIEAFLEVLTDLADDADIRLAVAEELANVVDSVNRRITTSLATIPRRLGDQQIFNALEPFLT